jgi:hypothetical protein
MSINRPALPVVLAAALCASAIALPAQQSTGAVPVPLTDPGRPGSVKVSLMNGGITVRGENRQDVLVTSRGGADDQRRGRQPDPPPGLTRLTQGAGLTITEENNQVTVSGTINRQGDVEIRVPTRTNLKLSGLNGSDMIVENVDGEIEATHMNAGIRLTNVAGAVVANSHNGDVLATLTRITGDRAMAFTSFNGNVDVTLPATAKANLKMRSDNGDIYTDFDVQIGPAAPQTTVRRDGRTRIEVNSSIYGTINGGGPEFELRTFNGNIYVRKGQ